MSRVGKAPIPIPAGVAVEIDGAQVAVSGPKGRLQWEIPGETSVELADGELRVARHDEARRSRALHGLARALLANMVTGVSEGFAKTLEIVGVGYRAAPKGSAVELALGFSHPIVYEPPEGVEVEVVNPTRLVVKGVDKQKVGQAAAEIRKFRPPEPYKGKGVRYEGERIIRKAGKTGA